MIAGANPGDAIAIAAAVRSRQITARAIAERCLAAIARTDPILNCFTAVLADRALASADRIDARLAAGEDPGQLAGVPYGVKNLFDIAGQTTLAGSKIFATNAPAKADAALVARMDAAGAVLVGALNMDEFAYGFSTENEHYGPTRNPHDTTRIAGGSSGGSAAVVAAQLLPLALGTDTNGSVRVPAALCGVFGLKPTHGGLDGAGMYPFAHSLDHPGLFARSVTDLAIGFDALRDVRLDSAPTAASLSRSGTPLRVAMLGGWFAQASGPGVAEAMACVAAALGHPPVVELRSSDVARSAAFCITAAEGGALHLDRLRHQAGDFDIATRDRLIAGSLLPAAVLERALYFRDWYRAQAKALFAQYDLLIAPATICSAPRIGESCVTIAGEQVPVRANLGLFTQPLSFIGLPVISAPVVGLAGMPLGVQIVAPWWREDLALGLAARLESEGVLGSRPAPAPITGQRMGATA